MTGSDPAEPSGSTTPGRAQRRGLTVAVLAAVAGGAAGYFATGRVWASETVERVAPLAPETVHTTGRDLVPWAAAAAVVGVAGGLALLATRGRGRLAVAVLLTLAGLGTVVGGVRGLTGDTTFVWPLLCVAGANAPALQLAQTTPTRGTTAPRCPSASPVRRPIGRVADRECATFGGRDAETRPPLRRFGEITFDRCAILRFPAMRRVGCPRSAGSQTCDDCATNSSTAMCT